MGRRRMEDPSTALCFLVNKIGASLGHCKGGAGVPVILVTHLRCLDASQSIVELSAAQLCRCATGAKEQL